MSKSIPGCIQGMKHYFTLSNTKSSQVFLPIDCVLKGATDTSDHPYNSKLKDKHNVRQLIPNDVEFDCPVCYYPLEVGEGVKLSRCRHHCCKYVAMLK